MKKENEIFFRASSIGALMVEGRGTTLTENQKSILIDLEARNNGIGKPLTENQKASLNELILKKNAVPELSDTAKTYIKRMWLFNEKGFYENLENKYVDKGLLNEQDGINLISEIDKDFYLKNKERIYKNNITGECDIIFTDGEKTIVKDIKCPWNPATFMNAELSKIYEMQGRAYMYLYDADEFHLQFCLTDTPEHLVNNEKKKIWYKYYSENMTIEEVEEMEKIIDPLYKQIEKNLVFSNNPAYQKSEMVKTFIVKRDIEIEKNLLSKIPKAIEFYNSLTLNGIN